MTVLFSRINSKTMRHGFVGATTLCSRSAAGFNLKTARPHPFGQTCHTCASIWRIMQFGHSLEEAKREHHMAQAPKVRWVKQDPATGRILSKLEASLD